MATRTAVTTSLFQRIQPWLVVFSAALFFFFEFMQVNMFNALGPSLFRAFHLTNTTALGQLSASYMYATVLFLFPAGMILDRFSTRRLIIGAMIACVTCTLLFSFTTAFWQAIACRFITGFVGAFCLLSCVRLASRWFLPKHMALVIGLVVTFAMTGGMIAQKPFETLITLYGWRNTLRIDAASGYIMLIFILLFVRDYPAHLANTFHSLHDSLEKIGFWVAMKGIVQNSQNWLGGIYTSLVNLPIFLLGSTWGSWYLIQTQNLSRDQAPWVISMLFIGMIIGSPAIGWISDWFGERKKPMILGAIASLMVIFAIMYVPHLSFFDLMLLFFALGFVISAQIISYPLIAESNPVMLTATAEGLASVLIMSGGFVIPAFPVLLNLYWNHAMHRGIPFYSMSNYHLAFWIMPAAFILAFFIALAVKETHCRSLEENQSLKDFGNKIKKNSQTELLHVPYTS